MAFKPRESQCDGREFITLLDGATVASSVACSLWGDAVCGNRLAGLLILFIAMLASGRVLAQSGSHTPKQTVTVGLIAFARSELRTDLERSLIEGLRQRGFVEGSNLILERRYASGDPDRVPLIARELADSSLDAIVTTCTPTTLAMKEAMKEAKINTPLVMASVSDPVGQGLIASYPRPGGNITGTASQFEELAPKMLQLLHEVVPRVTAAAVLFNPRNSVHHVFLKEMEETATSLNMRLTPLAIAKADEVATTFESMPQRDIGAVIVLPDDSFFFDLRPRIIEQTTIYHLPSFFGIREAVEEGGLISYGENLPRSYSRAAYYLARILGGDSPASLPVEQPNSFELVINLKTTKALGLTMPIDILLRADKLIE
jgi:putative tryptophan/tyrosine transport system substrate-binding protein